MLRNALRLSSRALLRVAGNEAETFLQGLITKDIGCIHIDGVIYAFLLNARGRICADLLIYRTPNDLLLETDASRLKFLERTLAMYRLRRNVIIEPVNDSCVYFLENQSSAATEQFSNAYVDPRIHSFGYRLIAKPGQQISNAFTEEDYLSRRLQWNIPEGFDEIGDQIPLQANGDLMNGISFVKGCYIGQELVARTHHTGVIRRRVLPIGTANESMTTITGRNLVDDDDRRQGKVLRTQGSKGIALVSLANIGKTLFDEAHQPIIISTPIWWPKKLP